MVFQTNGKCALTRQLLLLFLFMQLFLVPVAHDDLERQLNMISFFNAEEDTSRESQKGTTEPIYSHIHNMMFLHVGKAGGVTNRQVLEAGCRAVMNRSSRKLCFENLPQTALSNAVKYYIHVRQSKDAHSTDGFVIAIRNPLSRFVSAYYQQRPLNRTGNTFKDAFYFDCFSNVNEAGLAMTTTVGGNQTCKEVTWNLVKGQLAPRDGGHVTMNLEWYAKNIYQHPLDLQTNETKPIFVVRTEHLWDDLIRTDKLLGGNGNFSDMQGFAYTHGSEKNKDERPVMLPEAAKNFCCGLWDEYVIYHRLLMDAANLDSEMRATSWATGLESCGYKTFEEFTVDCMDIRKKHDSRVRISN